MRKRVKKVLIIKPRRAFSSLEAFVFCMLMSPNDADVCAHMANIFKFAGKRINHAH